MTTPQSFQFRQVGQTDNDAKEVLTTLLSALLAKSVLYGDRRVGKTYHGDRVIWEQGEQNVLPVGKTDDIVNNPDDNLKLWASETIRNAFQSEVLSIEGLESVISNLTVADQDDYMLVRDSEDADTWKLIQLQDLRGIILTAGVAIRIHAEDITANYDNNTNQFVISARSLKQGLEQQITALTNRVAALERRSS